MTTRCSALQRRIDAWLQAQLLYMPSVIALRGMCDSSDKADIISNLSENIKLWLPSELKSDTPCNERLKLIEWELQYMQANDALNKVQ